MKTSRVRDFLIQAGYLKITTEPAAITAQAPLSTPAASQIKMLVDWKYPTLMVPLTKIPNLDYLPSHRYPLLCRLRLAAKMGLFTELICTRFRPPHGQPK
ncbi:hypothetical protein K443DRAFT_323 [Laccaria amethystina LaAM-08-1]|uniref:Uncharacterized protein n=1 Tax=Laccaria amethystina LaAM-08-1 TaxID=1095629 RepID=A0A0C9YNU5_9AGAR|nr:hypothetical protein K443DRAFT_323 [Laccaria amethystina LaAM-08-1]